MILTEHRLQIEAPRIFRPKPRDCAGYWTAARQRAPLYDRLTEVVSASEGQDERMALRDALSMLRVLKQKLRWCGLGIAHKRSYLCGQ